METAYAQALWKLVQNGKNPKDAVHALHEVLVRLGRASLLYKIGRAFAKIAQRDQSRNDVVLTVAREKDSRTAQKEAKEFFSSIRVDSGEVLVRVDDSLIGGWRLEGREQLVDSSFKKQLLSIYNHATRS